MTAESATAEALDRRRVAKRALRTLLFASLIGAIAGAFTAAFMFLMETGRHLLWENLPEAWGLPSLGIAVALVCALGVGLLRRHEGKEMPFEEQFETSGRISYASFPRMLSTSMLSLWSGASVGPEATLSHLAAQISTYTIERLHLPPELGRSLIIGGVAAAFGAFLGSPVVGTFLVFEMFEHKKYDYAAWILPAFLASAISYTVYVFFMPTVQVIIFSFPSYTKATIIDLLWAIPLATCGALLGIAFGYLYKQFGLMINRHLHRPVTLALMGGLAIVVTALVAPIALFSGHNEIPELIAGGAAVSGGVLLIILVIKMLLTAIGFHTGFKGGPIFPLIFIGTAAAMLISHLFSFVPSEVAIIAVATGVVVLELRLPVSTIILMTVLSGIVWMPVIIFAAFVSYIWLIFVSSFEKQPELIKLIPE